MVGMPSRAMLNILRNLVGATRSFLKTQKSLPWRIWRCAIRSAS